MDLASALKAAQIVFMKRQTTNSTLAAAFLRETTDHQTYDVKLLPLLHSHIASAG